MQGKIDLAAFRDDDDDAVDFVAPKRNVELTQLKSKTFSHGITKKTKKDLEREAEEKKRIEEEKAQALVMAEYEEAFERPAYSSTSFIPMRAGMPPRGAVKGSGFVRAGGMPMVPPPFAGPSAPMPGFDPPKAPASMPPRGPAAMGYNKNVRPPPRRELSPPPSSGPKPKGKREMDSFLEEIKGNQQQREQRLGTIAKVEGSSITALAAWEGQPGGRPQTSDAESTNVFIANLPHDVTEDSLGMLFAKYGPVGTVKIMWPRNDEPIMGSMNRRGQTGFTGFVLFMKRRDAERAVQELEGINWGGSVLKLGWSRAMPLPARAAYDTGASRGRDRSPSPRRDERDQRDSRREASYSRSPSPKRGNRHNKSPSHSSHRRRSRSVSSGSSRSYSPPPRKRPAVEKWLAKVAPEQEKFIKTVAGKVKDHGRDFEKMLRDKEKQNPKFGFLFNEDSPEYHVYKLALSSRHRVPTPPPEGFEDEGYASLYSSDSAEDSERERIGKRKIGRLARKRFESILRAMTGKRVEIARAMQFAVNHAETADEVADIICQSLRLDNTPVPRKIARLHLVSDILHNSASPLPNVWKYRMAFEKRLPPVFAHLHDVLQSLDAYSGKISADVFKAQILAVLDVWERWIVYTQDVSETYRGLFEGTRGLDDDEKAKQAELERLERQERELKEREKSSQSKFKSSGFKSSFKPVGEVIPPPARPIAQADSARSNDQAGMESAKEDAEDLDGEEMADDLDGEAMEDLDGEAMDEDLDGEAM